MKKLTLFFLLFIGCILCNSQLSMYYATTGLKLWFEKMIPALLPFMILSGIMVRMELTEKIAMLIYPLVHPLYGVSKNVCYCMLMGFLCGFPMGAKVVADLYGRNRLTRREATYLLAFCNNIGPVYFLSFALPMLQIAEPGAYLFGMYGIPLLYGLLLRYTCYRDIAPIDNITQSKRLMRKNHIDQSTLICCEQDSHNIKNSEKLLAALDDSIHSSLQSILMLGGYMILFNLLNLIPHLLSNAPNPMISPLLEITGGLQLLQNSLPLYSLIVLSFGGLSCLAQTYSCISNTDLELGNYIKHKCILTGLTALYYFCLFSAFYA